MERGASLKQNQQMQAALVAPLFDRVISVMIAHALPCIQLLLLVGRIGGSWPLVILFISSVVWLVRVSILIKAKRDQLTRGLQGLLAWKIPYQLTGLAWAATVGAGSFISIVCVQDEAIRVIAITLPLCLAAAISSRNSGTPRYALALILLLLVPVLTASASLGSYYWIASLMHVGFLGAVLSILKRSHADLVNLLTAEQQNSHLAGRLDVALTNMKQGLTLFDASGALEIVNSRFIDIFGLVPGQLLPGTPFTALLEFCRDAVAEQEGAGDASATLLKSLALAGAATGTLWLRNGTIVAVVQEPLAGGGWLTSYEDITERHRTAENVVHMAYHDALTGLANRIKFNDRLTESLALLDRGDRFAVLYLDLDKFKPVNDLYGHAVGDRLLVEVAERMRGCLRKSDLVARLGGDEFAIIVSYVPGVEVIHELAQRLLQNVSHPYQLGEYEIVIGTSIGLALAPDHGSDAATLLKAADQSLYSAKSQGRGRFCFSNPVELSSTSASA